MRKIQIGVVGSMLDIKLEKRLKSLAEDLGREIAKAGAALVFGLEKDFNSLPMIAARHAEKFEGETIAFITGASKQIPNDLCSKIVVTGSERGGGREFPFVLSCDVLICIGGGSGTLNEISIAYQAGIPTIAIKDSGGWSTKLANQFLDERKRQKVVVANTARGAVTLALKLARRL